MTEQSEHNNKAETKATTSSGLRDLIERTFLAGMGVAALTKDRIQELVDESVRRGQLSSEEGSEIVDRLVTWSREETRAMLKKADASLRGAYREFGLCTRRELEDVELRLRQIEHRVQLLETAAGSGEQSGAAAHPKEDAAEA